MSPSDLHAALVPSRGVLIVAAPLAAVDLL
jgi:hypothetical protein